VIAQVPLENRDLLTAIAAIAVILFGGGGLYALLKVRPEAARISVDAAQGAVIVQTGVIDALRAENRRLADRLSELERTSSSVEHLRERIEHLEAERHVLTTEAKAFRGENTALRSRVLHLETELAGVKTVTEHLNDGPEGGK
jgi:chromosome segregation ATPase